ncbi:hypothetical protein [Brachybacterium sp. sponge]|uniref:hypothetical protein n=1 Tax=Brachybacterium sp. sponge TaxID=1775432 RepID=UPI0007A41848|nr:hypothetical protein [Brachybacterium sp. sponge]
MMTTFYTFTKDSDPQGSPVVAVDHQDRVYFFVANTKLWHHSARLEIQLDTNDADWTATEVPVEDVPALIAAVKKMDGRGHSGRYLRDLKAQPVEDKLTNAELGLLTAAGDRPVAGGEVRELLRSLPVGARRDVALYTSDRKAVAQNLAYELNNRLKKSLADIPLRAGTSVVGSLVVVRVKKVAAPRQQKPTKAGSRGTGQAKKAASSKRQKSVQAGATTV